MTTAMDPKVGKFESVEGADLNSISKPDGMFTNKACRFYKCLCKKLCNFRGGECDESFNCLQASDSV